MIIIDLSLGELESKKYLTEDLIKNDFSLATHFALKLSSHDLAKSLPGYKGE
jgi:hypothetical protein